MARYNTSLASATINGATTISSPIQGAFTALTGTAPYAVTLPAPSLFPGSNQTFYNATNGTITLTTPSGIFSGTGGSGLTTTSVFLGNVVSVTSDGTNYVVISEDGSILSATTGSFSSDVSINGTLTIGSTGGLTVAPSVQGSINNVSVGATTRASGAFTTLAANNSVSFTANTASSSTSTGTLVVTGGIGVSGQVTASTLTGTLQTAAQPNITSVGTLGSLSVTNTINSFYVRRSITMQGAPNLGTHQGYLLLAKAYVSGLQDASYVKGYFTITRGSTGTGNKSDIFYVNSQSAYNAETFLVTGSTNGGFWSRTVKVTYGGTVYHAIETGNGGGEPSVGTFFTGEFVNCSPILTDATFVTNVTAYGNWNLTNANSGEFFTGGTGGINVTDTIGWSSGFRNMSSFTMPNITGGGLSIGFGKAGSSYNLGKIVYNHVGDGSQSNYVGLGFWDRDNILSVQASGAVGINTTNPQTKFNINYGAGSAVGDAVIRIGGTSNYASLELGIRGAYDGMIRTYGNDLHLFSGHWQTSGSTATENHSMFFYTSQNGSTNWNTPKMTLSNVGNLTITGTLTESSSITLKENIEPITGALASVLQLDGKIYDRIDNKEKGEAGLIAEQVFKVLPNLVHVDENGKPVGVKYTKTVAYLVESIKELYEEIRKLKGQ